MASLQDQLLKAGLTTKQKTRQANSDKRKKNKQKRSGVQHDETLQEQIKQDLAKAKAEKQAKDNALNEAHKRQLAQKEQLVGEKRKNDKAITNTQKAFQKEFNTIRADHISKKSKMTKAHEKDYQETYAKNEYVLKNLFRKKEVMLEKLRQMLKTEAKKEVIKNKDNFYHFTDLDPKYELNEQKNGYVISMKVPEHEVKNVSLSGHRRQLKITMDRDFKYTQTDTRGAKDSINRVESYTSKIPVEYMVDAKTIQKSYTDGVLTFKIGFA